MPVWKVKEKTVGSNGLKTTRTVTTEDPNIVRSLIDAPKNNSSKANTTKSTPAAKPKKPKGLIAQLKDAVVAPMVEMPGEKREAKKAVPRLKKESKPKLEPPKAKAPAKPKALPTPKKESKKKATSKKTTVVNTVSDNSFIPNNETIIFHQGKWVITKKAIGGLFTYSLYEKDYCRTQLIFMPNDDKKALNELKNSMKEEFF